MTIPTTMTASIDEPTCNSHISNCVAKLLLKSREKGDIRTHPLDVVGTVIVPVRAKKQLSPRRVVASAIRGRRTEKLMACAVRGKGERERK